MLQIKTSIFMNNCTSNISSDLPKLLHVHMNNFMINMWPVSNLNCILNDGICTPLTITARQKSSSWTEIASEWERYTVTHARQSVWECGILQLWTSLYWYVTDQWCDYTKYSCKVPYHMLCDALHCCYGYSDKWPSNSLRWDDVYRYWYLEFCCSL